MEKGLRGYFYIFDALGRTIKIRLLWDIGNREKLRYFV